MWREKRNLISAGALLLLGVLLPFGGAAAPGGDASDHFFAQTNAALLRLTLSEPALAALREFEWVMGAPNDNRQTVQGTLREGATEFTNVAIHLKGAAGSFQSVDKKPGLTLNFDKFAKGQRFHGLQKISLNNSRQDATYITDMLCRELFARIGVPAPRTAHVRVELNGRNLGLYVLTEGWNKQFLKRHFVNAGGNLYDSGFVKDINGPLEVNSGDHPEDRSDLARLEAAALEPDLAARKVKLARLLDLDQFLRFIALDAMMWNWDGYGINRNNYRVFHDLDTDHMVFFPHGLDQMFRKADGPLMPGMQGLVARSVLELPELRRRYLQHAAELTNTVFQLGAITNRVMQLASRIRPLLAGVPGESPAAYDRALELLISRITRRIDDVNLQLGGSRKMLQFDGTNSLPLRDWTWNPRPGVPPGPGTPAGSSSMEIAAAPGGAAGSWRTQIWLEAGTYRVQGRIRLEEVVAPVPEVKESGPAPAGPGRPQNVPRRPPALEPRGAGFRVFSSRKITDGSYWGWLPFRESRDLAHRGDLPPLAGSGTRLMGTVEWTPINHEFELRQPLADLTIACELHAVSGRAVFDPASLSLVRVR